MIDSKGIKILRAKLGMNQLEFAVSLGISKGHLSRVEADLSPITEKLDKLIRAKYPNPENFERPVEIPEEVQTEISQLRKRVKELTRELEQLKQNFQILLETHSKQLVNDKRGGVMVAKSVTLFVDPHAQAA